MARYRIRARPRAGAPTDPHRYVVRRLSSWLVVAGAVAGVAALVLLDHLGLPDIAAVIIGLLVFVGAAVVATRIPAATTAQAPRR